MGAKGVSNRMNGIGLGRGLCRAAILLLAILYLVAVATLLIGAFGATGQSPDGLAGLYVILLGLPWSLLIDPLPEGARPWAAVILPLVNLGILMFLCRRPKRPAPNLRRALGPDRQD